MKLTKAEKQIIRNAIKIAISLNQEAQPDSQIPGGIPGSRPAQHEVVQQYQDLLTKLGTLDDESHEYVGTIRDGEVVFMSGSGEVYRAMKFFRNIIQEGQDVVIEVRKAKH